MPDYQQGKIYKLWSPQGTEDEIYYGSTTDELRFRKSNHKNNYNKCKSKILFKKYDDVRIELVEEYPCNSKAELNKKEGEYIRNNKCLNKFIPDRTRKEYYQDNKEIIQDYQKEYRENNKENQKEYNKEWREKNKETIKEKVTCECGCIIVKRNLTRHQKTKIHIKLMEEKNNNI